MNKILVVLGVVLCLSCHSTPETASPVTSKCLGVDFFDGQKEVGSVVCCPDPNSKKWEPVEKCGLLNDQIPVSQPRHL